MPQYLLETSHTEAECVRTLDIVVEYGMHLLQHMWFGCMVGVHTGWMNLEAESETDARAVLPTSLRSHARIVEVEHFTPEKIKELH